ncbi:DoxX family protein [Variovorax sp. J22P168]|uniref:DoxX family protein n=1 Tax=Variovorax jilinensis TaxID=3053513 RepID=UPI00257681D8|nr:DoxX family protein [Variovorax sp. J22P168]MDM0012041.1 DoxX family protein [Variovorax sp. J22P168]
MTTTTASNYAAPATTAATQDAMALVGRILIALLFIPAGFAKLTGFAGTVGYITAVGLPLPQVAAAIAVIVELGLGILLLVGFKTRLTALVLALFTLATAFFFHNYWAMPVEKVQMNQLQFFKNLAIAGGVFAFAAFGGGRFSIDRK